MAWQISLQRLPALPGLTSFRVPDHFADNNIRCADNYANGSSYDITVYYDQSVDATAITNTLNGAINSSVTSLTLGSAPTYWLPTNGFLRIDGEDMFYASIRGTH